MYPEMVSTAVRTSLVVFGDAFLVEMLAESPVCHPTQKLLVIPGGLQGFGCCFQAPVMHPALGAGERMEPHSLLVLCNVLRVSFHIR